MKYYLSAPLLRIINRLSSVLIITDILFRELVNSKTSRSSIVLQNSEYYYKINELTDTKGDIDAGVARSHHTCHISRRLCNQTMYI